MRTNEECIRLIRERTAQPKREMLQRKRHGLDAACILGAYTGFHSIYNLLITAEGLWKMAGCLFLSVLIADLFVIRRLY